MQSVLITGGAGFIGQNLVHAWRAARPADRLVVVDAMTYAANVRSLEPLIADRSILLRQGRHQGCRADAAAVRGTQVHPRRASRRGIACRSLDRRSRSIPADQRARHLHAAQDRARRVALGRHARSQPLSPRLDRRGLWLAAGSRSRLFGDLAVSSQFALRREQGGQRPSGARLCRDLSAAGADHQLLEQLRFLSASGKADPADDHSCAGRQAAADLRRRLQRPRLAARIGSLRRR